MLFQEDLQRNVLRVLRRIENFLGLPCHDFTQGVADVEIIPAIANDTVAINFTTNSNSSSSSSNDPLLAAGTGDSTASLVILVHHHHSWHGKTAAEAGWWLLTTTQAVLKAMVNGVLGLLNGTTGLAFPAATSSRSPSLSPANALSSFSGPGGPGPGRSGSSSRHSARLQQQVLGDTLTLIPAAAAAAMNTRPDKPLASWSPPTLRALLVALYQDHNRRLLEYTTNLPREWIET